MSLLLRLWGRLREFSAAERILLLLAAAIVAALIGALIDAALHPPVQVPHLKGD